MYLLFGPLLLLWLKKMNNFPFCLTDRVNNFPPLPKFLRIKPCFYQNVDEEIPQPHCQLVRRVYNLWICE